VPADFREMIRTRSAETGIVRADDLEFAPEGDGYVRRVLHYYVPCVVRGRMVAVIGLGRSADGALLSSEDVEILRTVSGYIAVAIENSLLYQEQQQRAAELELLKEFNESIVESINVGLMAVDLDGRNHATELCL
jgi:GAF domain-containing protein